MKKILLVTLQSVNIGNRLQNYALQTVLKNLKYQVYTPIYMFGIIDKFKLICKSLLGFLGIKKYRKDAINLKRIYKFSTFNKKYIDNLVNVSFTSVYKKTWNDFDYAITGSDQVWHQWSKKPKEELKYFYLAFMPKEKRISYAASFGFSEFPKEYIDIHKDGLNGINVLSCREKKGVEMIQGLVNRKAELVVDPTLLLSENDWKKIEKKPQYYIPKKYVLLYFLGSINKEYNQVIQNYAKQNQCEIIDIYNIDIRKYYYTKPDEFLWLIHNANYVFTDSFHACVFSIIYNKNFVAFKRCEIGMDKMFDRIETLLSEFELENCIYQKDSTLCLKIDYGRVNKLLVGKAEKGMCYLKKALN